MSEHVIAFLIWTLFAAVFIVLGLYASHSKKPYPFGFWANAEIFPVEDIKGYNKALGKLYGVFGIMFALLGLPLLAGEDSPYIVFSILGTLFLAISMMAVYITKIEKSIAKNNRIPAELYRNKAVQSVI